MTDCESSFLAGKDSRITLRYLNVFQLKEMLKKEGLKIESIPNGLLIKALVEVITTNKLTNPIMENEKFNEFAELALAKLTQSPRWVKICREEGMSEKEIRSIIALPIRSDTDFKILGTKENILNTFSPVLKEKINKIWRQKYISNEEIEKKIEMIKLVDDLKIKTEGNNRKREEASNFNKTFVNVHI